MPAQKIPKGTWNKSQTVDFCYNGKFQETITKNKALTLMTGSLREGLKVETGVTDDNCNFLFIGENI